MRPSLGVAQFPRRLPDLPRQSCGASRVSYKDLISLATKFGFDDLGSQYKKAAVTSNNMIFSSPLMTSCNHTVPDGLSTIQLGHPAGISLICGRVHPTTQSARAQGFVPVSPADNEFHKCSSLTCKVSQSQYHSAGNDNMRNSFMNSKTFRNEITGNSYRTSSPKNRPAKKYSGYRFALFSFLLFSFSLSYPE